jgi:hypothetical protein
MCRIKGFMCLNPLMVLLLGLWVLWIQIGAQMHALYCVALIFYLNLSL